jgi:hypothetical protein
MYRISSVVPLPNTTFTQYIGNGAKPQLVKNGENTVIGFRNLLGHS